MHLIQSLETHFTWLYSLSIYVVWYLIKLDIFMVLTLQCRCGVNSNCCSGWKSFKSNYSKMQWSSIAVQYTETGGMRHCSSMDRWYEALQRCSTERQAVWDTAAVWYTETGGIRCWSSTVHRDWWYVVLELYGTQRLTVWGLEDWIVHGRWHWRVKKTVMIFFWIHLLVLCHR